MATDLLSNDAALTGPQATTFRPDVEGLRAVAIITVVLFHYQLPPFTGGYIGVDVFFVISGYVITRMLLRERDRSGRTSLREFYARRVRRILPAATVVLIVTTLLTFVLLGASSGRATAHDAISAALFYANVHFAHSGSDYLNSSIPPSPLVHFWSLSIEEQFYFVWPSLLALIAILLARHRRVALTLALSLIWVGSMAYSITLTSTNGNAAFYSSMARAGELALGALVAVNVPLWRRVPKAVAIALSWLGLIAILVCAMTYTNLTIFPGRAVIWPTVATAVAIAAGEARHREGAQSLLGAKIMVAIGAISYSLYLWHWPLYALVTQRLGYTPQWWWRAGLVVVALVLATASYSLLENPIRRSERLRRSTRNTLVLGALVTALTVTTSLVALAAVPVEANLPAPPAPTTQSALSTAIARGLSQSSLGRLVVPLSNIGTDFPSAGFDRGCMVAFTAPTAIAGRPSDCAFGDRSAQRTLVLFGDSNADMWIAAFDALGRTYHFRVELLARASCQLPDLKLWNPALHAPGTACTEFRQWAIGQIASIHPFATVLADYEYGLRWNYQDELISTDEAAAGLERTIASVAHHSGTTVMMDVAPAVFSDPAQCLHVHSGDIQSCASPVVCLTSAGRASPTCAFDPSTGRSWAMVERLGEVTTAGGGVLAQVNSLFCTTHGCPPVVSGIVVNYDIRHVTMHYSLYVAPVLARILAADGVALSG